MMKMRRSGSHIYRSLMLMLCGVLLFAGCQGEMVREASLSPISFQESRGDARLSVFLRLKEPEGPSLWLKINNLEVRSGNNWLPIGLARQEVESREISANGQIMLGRGGLPAGRYQALKFTVEQAALAQDKGTVSLALEKPDVEINFPAELTLNKEDSTSLFVTWDTTGSMVGSTNISPIMTVVQQRIPLATDLAYVSCPEIDTIYVIRTDNNMVCGSLGISGKPSTVVLNPAQNRFFVLTGQDSSIKILELTSNRQIDQVKIPVSVKATYMAVSRDGRWAYVIDEIGNNLLRLNLQTGNVEGQVRTGSRPKFILYIEELNQLAISCAYAQRVYFLDPTSLATINTIDTGGSPDGLLMKDNYLYVAESSGNSVSVFGLPGGGSNQLRLNVGTQPRRIIWGNSHIYIANYGDGTVSVLRPGQLSAARSLRVGGHPFEMGVSSVRQWLYVGDTQNGGITVIDLSVNKRLSFIELGAAPDSIAVIN